MHMYICMSVSMLYPRKETLIQGAPRNLLGPWTPYKEPVGPEPQGPWAQNPSSGQGPNGSCVQGLWSPWATAPRAHRLQANGQSHPMRSPNPNPTPSITNVRNRLWILNRETTGNSTL